MYYAIMWGMMRMIVTISREFMFHKDREELLHTGGDPAAEGPATSASTTEYHLACVPRRSVVCERSLAEHSATFSLHSLPIYFYPLDTDLVSMELPLSFRGKITMTGYLDTCRYCRYCVQAVLTVTRAASTRWPRR